MTRIVASAKRVGAAAALLALAHVAAVAQTTISGTIVDPETDEPLIGANILVVGTSTGTITDLDGNYELTVPEDGAQIRVSYTGYSPQTIDLAEGVTQYDIELTSGELLEEVVVVGYGTETQQEVTSAVTSVKEEDFNQGVVNNPTQLVQGKVAGLQIAQPGGDPNGQPTIRLRGLSTLGANSEPLVIIDGVIGATLNSVDPSDIASIDVLKDGSAAAIYGTRASSGVIIVTTKGGRAGETQVSYRVQGGVENLAKSIEVADADQFVELRDGAGDFGARNDVFEEITRTALSQVHNVSLSGGLGSGSYRASLNYRDVEGVAKFSEFEQLNGRINVRQSALDDKLDFDLSASATSRSSKFGFNEAFRYATIFNPTIPLGQTAVDDQLEGLSYVGGYAQVDQFDYFNPVAINEQNTNTGNRRDVLLSGRVSYSPIAGLDLSAQYSTNFTNEQFDAYYDEESRFLGADRGGLGRRTNLEDRNDLFEVTGNYVIDIGNNSEIELLGGYSYQQLERDRLFVEGGNAIGDFVQNNNFNFFSDFANGFGTVESNGDRSEIESYFGRVSLDIGNQYFVKASLRRDGSTRFGPEEVTGVFPAISGGVNVASFIEDVNVNTIKLRAGYGITGNIPAESNLSRSLVDQVDFFFLNGEFVPAYGITRNSNPDLRFERKGELNVGVDLAFFDYRLTGSFDYFNRVTDDLIFENIVSLPGVNPASGEQFVAESIFANLDDISFKNEGIEIALGYDVLNTESFAWTPRIVFSTVTTSIEIEDEGTDGFNFFPGGDGELYQFSTSPGAPGQNNAPTQVIRAGEELGLIYTYVYEGVDDEGNFIFEDLDGDGDVSIAAGASPDKAVVGNGLPDWTFGFQNEFRYGNWDASAFFRGAFGHSLANMPRNFYENLSPSRGTDNVVVTENFNPDLTFEQGQFNSYYVEKGDFVTLDNASVGYSFDLGSESAISNLRIALAGQRLFYITNYTGVDPEVRYSDNVDPLDPNILAPGIDRRNNYFRTRSFNLQASITF